MSPLTEARIANLRNHMALEVTHDWGVLIATFEHPRYAMHGAAGRCPDDKAVKRQA